MVAPTYTLRPSGAPAAQYARDVARLADETIAAGDALRAIVERYAAFVAATGREAVRSFPEYVLEALALGVQLWALAHLLANGTQPAPNSWTPPM